MEKTSISNAYPKANSGFPRCAGSSLLWGLAVSYVIIGEYAGWNTGLIYGGFGGMLIATFLVTLMYGCLIVSIAELSSAIPSMGGSLSYSDRAFGTWGGFIAGLSQILCYLFALSSITLTIGIEIPYLLKTMNFTSPPELVIWSLVTVVFLALNAWDTRVFFWTAFALTIISLVVLGIFFIAAIPHFQLSTLYSIHISKNGNTWLPNGLMGIAWALPFAIWLYVGLEVISLAAEEAIDPAKNIAKSFKWAYVTLIIAAFSTLVLNSGIPKIAVIGASDNPLLTGLQALFVNVRFPEILMLMAMMGSITSIHSTFYAAGRGIFSFARAGYLPTFLTKKSKRNTPHIALSSVALLSLLGVVMSKFFPKTIDPAALFVVISVLSIVVSYTMTLLSFIVLSVKQPDMPRPYISRFGVTGAITGLIILTITLILMIFNEKYWGGVVFTIALYIFSGCAFFLYKKFFSECTGSAEKIAQ